MEKSVLLIRSSCDRADKKVADLEKRMKGSNFLNLFYDGRVRFEREGYNFRGFYLSQDKSKNNRVSFDHLGYLVCGLGDYRFEMNKKWIGVVSEGSEAEKELEISMLSGPIYRTVDDVCLVWDGKTEKENRFSDLESVKTFFDRFREIKPRLGCEICCL